VEVFESGVGFGGIAGEVKVVVAVEAGVGDELALVVDGVQIASVGEGDDDFAVGQVGDAEAGSSPATAGWSPPWFQEGMRRLIT